MMSRLVPPKNVAVTNGTPIACESNCGSVATITRKMAPAAVSRDMLKSRKSAVGLPGRTPGI